MDSDKIVKRLKKLISNESSSKLLLESLRSLLPMCPKKGEYKKFWKQLCKIALFSFLAIYLDKILLYSNFQINKLINIISLINNIDLILLGIVFTGFSLFLGMLDKDVFQSMLLFKDKKKSGIDMFVELYKSYYYLMYNYEFNIFINFIFLTILNSVPKNAMQLLFTDKTIFAKFGYYFIITIAFFYILISVLIIYELKYFIFNFFTVYNLKIVVTSVEIMKEEKRKKRMGK